MEKLEQLMQVYHMVYLVCLFFLLIFLAVSIFLSVKWKVWEAIGILSGRTAVRAIRRGKLKKESGRQEKKSQAPKIQQEQTILLEQGEQTMVLDSGEKGEHFGITEQLADEQREVSAYGGMLVLEEIKEIHSQERV